MSHGPSRRTFLTWSSAGLASSAALAAEASEAAQDSIKRAIDVAAQGDAPAATGLRLPAPILDAAAELAIANAEREGFTDVFPRHFEADMLGDSRLRRRLRAHARASAATMDHAGIGGIEVISLPKRTAFAVRRIAVMRPADTIFYLTLAVIAAPQIESHRIANEQRRVFSYRFAPKDGLLFDDQTQYGDFVEAVNARLMSNGGVVVTADVESFYERISMPRLRDSLLACSVDERIVARIVALLDHWRSLGGDNGLPIGSNASRILAEAVLIPVDDALANAGVDFCRFVDDYRIFAPNLELAQAWLALLADRIERIGLTLNAQKTGIAAAADVLTAESLVEQALKADVRWRQAQADPRNPTTRPNKASPTVNPGGKAKTEPDIIKRPKYDPAPSDFKRDKGRSGYLQGIDLAALQQALSAGPAVKTNALMRTFVDAAVEQCDGVAIAAFPRLMTRYPQFAGYCASALVDCADELAATRRDSLADEFQNLLLLSGIRRDDFRMQIARVLGTPGFGRPRALLDFALHHVGRRDSYLVRVAIDGLRAVATRAALLELLPAYAAFGDWARRSIIAWAIGEGMADAVRQLAAASDDPLARALLEQSARIES